eukprot:8707-Heterococcus_DN1.PRE.1
MEYVKTLQKTDAIADGRRSSPAAHICSALRIAGCAVEALRLQPGQGPMFLQGPLPTKTKLRQGRTGWKP